MVLPMLSRNILCGSEAVWRMHGGLYDRGWVMSGLNGSTTNENAVKYTGCRYLLWVDDGLVEWLIPDLPVGRCLCQLVSLTNRR